MEHGHDAIIGCIRKLIAQVRTLPWVEGLRRELSTGKIVRSYSVGKSEIFDTPLTGGDYEIPERGSRRNEAFCRYGGQCDFHCFERHHGMLRGQSNICLAPGHPP